MHYHEPLRAVIMRAHDLTKTFAESAGDDERQINLARATMNALSFLAKYPFECAKVEIVSDLDTANRWGKYPKIGFRWPSRKFSLLFNAEEAFWVIDDSTGPGISVGGNPTLFPATFLEWFEQTFKIRGAHL